VAFLGKKSMQMLSWKDAAPAVLLAGVLFARFDLVTAALLLLVIASGLVSVRKYLKTRNQ